MLDMVKIYVVSVFKRGDVGMGGQVTYVDVWNSMDPKSEIVGLQ